VNDYPAAITAVNHVEPVPRRIRPSWPARRPAARTPHERGSGTAPLVPALPAPVTALFAMPPNRYRSDL
jgi:hypothetical protein